MTSTSVATMPRIPEASARVRSLLWTTFACWNCDSERVDDAALVLSELVGNAVRHAAVDTLRVRLRRAGSEVRLAVEDDSPLPPAPREASWEDESGRGMTIIEALSHRWAGSTAAAGRWCGPMSAADVQRPARAAR